MQTCILHTCSLLYGSTEIPLQWKMQGVTKKLTSCNLTRQNLPKQDQVWSPWPLAVDAVYSINCILAAHLEYNVEDQQFCVCSDNDLETKHWQHVLLMHVNPEIIFLIFESGLIYQSFKQPFTPIFNSLIPSLEGKYSVFLNRNMFSHIKVKH